jgi:hypothetical protein
MGSSKRMKNLPFSERNTPMTDNYTKAMLTIIAAALVVLSVQNAIPHARAQFGEPAKVQICDDSSHCAELLPKTDPRMHLLTWALAVENPER